MRRQDERRFRGVLMKPRLFIVAVALAAVVLAPSASSRAGHTAVLCAVDSSGTVTTSTDQASPMPKKSTTPRSLLGRDMTSPGYTTCGSYDWQVTPSYTGDYFSDTTSADAAEPPPPSAVTPSLPTWRDLYDWPNGHGYVGWHTASSSQAGAYGMQSALGNNYGLWLWPVGGSSYSYSTGQYAEWTFTAPGTTRLASATVNFTYKNKLLAHHCIDVGFRDANGSVITHNEHCTPVQPPDSQRSVTVSLVDPSANPTSITLYFRIRVDCGGAATCSKNIPQLDPLSTGGYARMTKADMTLVDDDVPTVIPSGTLYALDGDYTNGTGSYDLGLFANDPGSGVQRGWTDASTGATVSTMNNGCDPTHHTDALDDRICPQLEDYTTTVSLSQFPEGAVAFGERAIDLATTVGTSVDWTVYIDRTAPSAVTGIAEQAFDGTAGTVLVGWNEAVDPNLPDGNPGSGVQSYDYRYQLDGGAWSDWQTSDVNGADIDATHLGQAVNIQVNSIDSVGNVGASASASFTIVAKDGSTAPDEDTTQSPAADRRLTADQTARAAQLAQADSRIVSLIGGRATAVDSITPWTTSGGTVIGATLNVTWSGALTLATSWPTVAFDASGDTYTVSSSSYTASNVTSLAVMVDLARGTVVSYEPTGDAIESDATTADSSTASVNDTSANTIKPAQTSSGTSTSSGSTTYTTQTGATVYTAAALPVPPPPKPAPPKPQSCGVGGMDVALLTKRNTVGIGLDRFWNWDFCNRGSNVVTKAWALRNADNPVTVVFWGNVDVRTAKDIWNRGLADTRLLGSPAYGRVWDRLDPGSPTSHSSPGKPIWDSDRGAYLGRVSAFCTSSHLKWHYRVHAPGPKDGGDDRMYNPAWGYYVVATTHQDHNENLVKCGGYWSGNAEATEQRIADTAPSHTHEILQTRVGARGPVYFCTYSSDPWVVQDANTGALRRDTLNLHNYDQRGRIGEHVFHNDGLATMIHVSNISHPYQQCPQNP
jgi:hypothetical protein